MAMLSESAKSLLGQERMKRNKRMLDIGGPRAQPFCPLTIERTYPRPISQMEIIAEMDCCSQRHFPPPLRGWSPQFLSGYMTIQKGDFNSQPLFQL